MSYLAELFHRKDLLGVDLDDRTKVDRCMHRGNLLDLLVNFLVNEREETSEEKTKKRRKLNELYER